MCMIVFGTKNETYALSTYLPEEYYSDVVEKEVTLQKLQDGAKADSDDKYLVVDHEECWGTRDCTIFHLPEDGTVKISLKNIAEQRMYGSNVRLFSNKNLTKKINLELEVDGGEETSGSVYLEAGTYYMFTTSKNYDGNEFVEGNKAICRRTKVWVGYVPQSAFLSVNTVYIKSDGNDGPAYILKTFEINNIDGPDYSKEEHEAPAEEIPYVADYSQLLNNIQNGQAPILTHTQYRQSYSKAKKIVLTERTMLYSYISDICMVH